MSTLATDFLTAALPASYSNVLSTTDPDSTGETANWKLDETPVRCPLPGGIESGPGVRCFEFANGTVVVEGPPEAAADAGGAGR